MKADVAKAGDLVASRYRLVRLIAQGGMAQVWESKDEILTRPVAVKILLPSLASDRSFVARFRQEALAAARLSHPNIVSIYDTCSDDFEAIVMELIEGQTLREALDAEGSLSPEIAIDIALQVAIGLDHAHQQGLVHRDIKPANILLDHDGRVLITDFGIAKSETHDDLTEINQVVGTAKYLSPEQVESNPIDARSDIYSLGVVLYEMLSGTPPFLSDSSTATAIARLTKDPIPLRQINQEVSRALEAVVLCCLRRQPHDRYENAQDLVAALEDAAIDLDEDSTSFIPSARSDSTTTMARSPRRPDEHGPGSKYRRRKRPSRSTLTLLAVVGFTLLLVGVAIASTQQGKSMIDRFAARFGVQVGPLEPLSIVGIASFDPFGSDGEHDGELGLVLDDNPETGWTTERYQKPDVAGLKQGVGLVLSLKKKSRIEKLELITPTVAWQASFYIADELGPELTNWGEPIATKEGLSGNITVDLRGRSGTHVLIWITHLGDGRVGPRYSTQINQVQLLG